jgi:mannose-6-phosphate isomerase-like protein (cupin superfamily)
MTTKTVRKALPGFRWQGIDCRAYRDGSDATFRDVTRQTLFDDPAHASQLRYFEVAANGWSTLERHRHAHAVMILRGRGRCLVGDEVFAVAPHDLVAVPPLAWHQFRAGAAEPLGFLCMVDAARDRPQLPTPDELARLRALPAIAAFLAP